MGKDPIVTLELDVLARYTCSACGKENCLPDTASVTGSTASILALRKAARDRDLLELLPGGVLGAKLSCRCGCGHREPWAKLKAPLLRRLRQGLLIALALLAVAAYLLHTGDGGIAAALLALMAVCALGLLGLTLWERLRRRAVEKAMASLPPSALPKLRLKGK